MNPVVVRVGRLAQSASMLLLLVAGCAMVTASLAGVRLLPVMTGSMAPYAPAGALVVTTRVDPSAVQVGDVVAFRPPAPYEVAGQRPVMHRVAALEQTSTGLAMTTRGDANPGVDPWLVSLQGADLARVVAVSPVGGQLLAGGRLAVALLLGGLVALGVVARALIEHVLERRAAHRALQQPCPCAVGAVELEGVQGIQGASPAEVADVAGVASEGHGEELATAPSAVMLDLSTAGSDTLADERLGSPVTAPSTMATPSGLLPRPRSSVEASVQEGSHNR